MKTSYENSATRADHDHVFEVIMASLGSQVVRTLAMLSVAEHLHDTALTAEQVAARESSDPSMTYRLLRAGVALGFLRYEPETKRFVSTPRLDVLREDSPYSLKFYAQAAPGPAQSAVDVGGADGSFIAELLQRDPKLTGTVLDLPKVILGVVEAADVHGLQGRMIGITGDFFDAVPAADIYLLKSVLHDWDDEACVSILSNIRAAINPAGRMFIVEMVISAATSLRATLMDMAMLTAFTGQERELPQFEMLLDLAGFTISKTVALDPPFHLMEVHT